MSFGKVFAISIVSTLILNALLIVVAYAIGYGIDVLIAGITGDPMYILYMLFSSFGRAIWLNFDGIMYGVETANLGFLLLNIAYILSPLVIGIITGRLSDNRITSLLAVVSTAVISMLVCIILVMYSFGFQILIGHEFALEAATLNVVLGSVVNGCLYGLIALALTKQK
ncbi:MAG: hypothetical protein ACTSP9_16515 [Promethearchaeota archaeon]